MAVKAKSAPAPARARTTPAGQAPTLITQLTPNAANPRKAWEDKQREAFQRSLAEFGDLSGIVFNLTTKRLVGGHKRVDEFRQDKGATLSCNPASTTPDESGTVRYGYVILTSGARFAYREVRWPEPKEAAANLAANQWGAEWDLERVGDMVRLADTGGFDLTLTGFAAPELASFTGGQQADGASAESGFNYKPQYGVIVICDTEAEQESTYNTLSKQGHTCKVVTT